jgi:tripartite-type tricarboxylate transporter receptor subunit TctC
MLNRLIVSVALAAAACAWSAPAHAQKFPSKPVTLICPWPAGGSTDVQMRVLADLAGKHLGQPIVIENKPGGSGTVGAATLAASARPDGYTLSQMPITVFRQPHMIKTSFDPVRDFTYIIGLTGYTFGVVVHKDAPWKTFKELIDQAKANPGKVTYASPGVGTSLHITMAQLAADQGFKWTHVPQKGGAETTAALLGGHVNATADSTGWGAMVDSGQFRLLVTWGEKRTQRWPSVPTLKELGYGIVNSSPFGLAGPKGMDPALVQVLHDAFKKATDDPKWLDILKKLDQEPMYLNTADYHAHAMAMIEEQRRLVERLGLKQQ